MTMTELTAVSETPKTECPSWCTGRHGDRRVLSGDIEHDGERITIGLSLEAPATLEDTTHYGHTIHSPAELTIDVSRRLDAFLPTVTIGFEGGARGDSWRELTSLEAIELWGALGDVVDQLHPSTGDEAS